MEKIKTSVPDYIIEQMDVKKTKSKQYWLTPEQFEEKEVLLKKYRANKRKFKEVIIKKDKNGKVTSTTEKLQSKPIPVPENFELIKVSTSKTTGQQWTQYAPKKETEDPKDFDFESIITKLLEKANIVKQPRIKLKEVKKDFDMLTYTDLHIGMDPNKKGNSMYVKSWHQKEINETLESMVNKTLENQKSNVLIVDELGDFLDGYNGQTTRGGHELPQTMTNEAAFDCGLDFKMSLVNALAPYYDRITFNNICNDNHAGSFGYFVNSAFKQLAEHVHSNVTVNNYLQFISHYIEGEVCFIITHGKDDSTLKFGFKPHLDAKQIETIDHYIKQNKLYGKAERFIFKKGDSHQFLFDYTGSADFDYFNYMASSPPSQWVQNNFKNTTRGFVLESFKGVNSNMEPFFLK